MQKYIKQIITIITLSFSSLHFASAAILDPIANLVNSANTIISTGVAGLLFSLVTVTFFAVIINFIWKRRQGDAKGLDDAKNMLFWSVIGIFVMFSIWGIILFLQSNIFGGAAATSINKPQTTWDGSYVDATGGTSANRPITSTEAAKANCVINGGTWNATNNSCTKTTNSPINIRPANTGTGTSAPKPASVCTSASNEIKAANNQVLYCTSGVSGQPCKQGTCNWGYNCKIEDPTYSEYGVCVSI